MPWLLKDSFNQNIQKTQVRLKMNLVVIKNYEPCN